MNEPPQPLGHQTRGDAMLVLLQKFPLVLVRLVGSKACMGSVHYLCRLQVYVAVVLLVLLEFR